MLTEKQIEDPSGATDEKGNPKMINNPHYAGVSKSEAEKRAFKHIKATLDTQHLGMWFKNFKPKHGETEEERKKRFDNWYMDQVEKMQDEGIIGNIHLVDAMGAAHQHLPAGQGNLPVVKAIKRLKEKGYGGYINSEAHGEERFSQGRIMVETWSAFGNPIQRGYFSGGGAPQTWTDVRSGYFGKSYPPNFVFGAYSPSNDWTLWSQTPLE